MNENTNLENSGKSMAVVGAGLVGRGWSVLFANAGWDVRLYDINKSAMVEAIPAITRQATTMADYGLVDDVSFVRSRIQVEPVLSLALKGVQYVQECVTEQEDIKREVFADLDRIAPSDAILASSTSGIVASRFTSSFEGRQRMLVVHPVNPPHLVPLVELAPSRWTTSETIERARQIMEDIDQTPILVRKEIDGFILNRLQVAVLNEAIRLVDGDFVSPEDLDKTVRDGLGLRWSFMGPFETIDLNAPGGTQDYAKRFGAFFRKMAESQSSKPNWDGKTIDMIDDFNRQQFDLSDIPKRCDWRDQRLAALRSHKGKQPQ